MGRYIFFIKCFYGKTKKVPPKIISHPLLCMSQFRCTVTIIYERNNFHTEQGASRNWLVQKAIILGLCFSGITSS